MIKDKKFFRMDSILRPLERVILTTTETYNSLQDGEWGRGVEKREAGKQMCVLLFLVV